MCPADARSKLLVCNDQWFNPRLSSTGTCRPASQSCLPCRATSARLDRSRRADAAAPQRSSHTSGC
jgi:hypothetical protein